MYMSVTHVSFGIYCTVYMNTCSMYSLIVHSCMHCIDSVCIRRETKIHDFYCKMCWKKLSTHKTWNTGQRGYVNAFFFLPQSLIHNS